MKPRTKIQHEIFNLSESLPHITPKQEWWAFQKLMPHIGYRTTKGAITCLDCGHTWKGSVTDPVADCPCCGTKLNVQTTTKKRLFPDKKYMAIVDMRDGYQVVRIFQMWATYKKGEPVSFSIWEIIQQYFTDNNKVEIVARWKPFSYRDESWGGDLENRKNTDWQSKYDIWPNAIYPEYRVRPEYVRNGFDNVENINVSPYQLFRVILEDNKVETLLKIQQHEWLGWYVGRERNRIYKYWQTLKILFRNNYEVEPDNITSYLDYLDLLNYFDRDLHSPKYICPVDFVREHARYVAKKRDVERRRAAEAQRRKVEADKKQLAIDKKKYLVQKAPYFGLLFASKNIQIRVLTSVDDFRKESDIHKHCIFTNRYYSKENSLCFSASVNGVPMETIEIDLNNFRIVQARGQHNSPSKHHAEIVKFMTKNLSKVRKVHNALKVSPSSQQQIAA